MSTSDMTAALHCPLLVILLLTNYSEALDCYTCMGSNNDDCNRQGTKSCAGYSDACAVVVGRNSGVMKSCSYKSFCSQANSQGHGSPGVRVHCCYSHKCNVSSLASRVPQLNRLLLLLLLCHYSFK